MNGVRLLCAALCLRDLVAEGPAGSVLRDGSQLSIKEIRCRSVNPQPILVAQKVMHIVREDQLFKFDASLAKLSHKFDRLTELNVSIIVTVDQKHRRFPFVHHADR